MIKPTVHITIPKSPLRERLDEVARIKAEMTKLLKELEHQVAANAPDQPGLWRHDPLGWVKKDQ